MDQKPTKAPNRYDRWDEYTIAEVGRRFASGTRRDRFALLSECYAEGRSLPYEIASQVLDDPDPTIRLWMAKHARDLDLRERIWTAGNERKPEGAEGATEERKPGDEYKYPDRNLWEKLEADPDSLVRAALCENPAAPRHTRLGELSQLCRLAYMRNPEHARCGYYGVASDQILAVFDPSDKALGISESEREELAMAYLANPAVVAFSQEHMCYASGEFGPNDCPERRERLWQLLAHFPCARVKERGFRYLGGEDKWKAEVYRNIEEPWLRMELLLGARETDVELLRLGAADKEECCWEVARQKYIDPKRMKAGKPGMPESAWWTYTVVTISSVVPLFVAWLAFGLARTPF